MIILASISPRRHELMRMITADFMITAPDCDEMLPDGISPENAVTQLALRKALSIKAELDDIVIGADTVVAIEGKILGKPENSKMARDMLTSLSGKTHEVFTGVAIVGRAGQASFYCRTAVRFKELSQREIEDYIETGEPLDKAGAYGIQGGAASFIENIDGDYHNVMGLPVSELARRLSDFVKI